MLKFIYLFLPYFRSTIIGRYNFMMSFKPNRELLNPNFNGYKLADHSLPLLWETFTGGVHKIGDTCSDSFFSYQHVRQATMNNSLTFDLWNDSHVYWTTANTHNIMCGYLSVSN